MASLRKSIDEHCKYCCYDPADEGSWRHQVERCGATDCPLWAVRPVTTATIEKARIAKAKAAKKIDVKVTG